MAETEKRRVPTDENGRPLSREEMAERRERARQRAVARSKRRFRRFFWVYTAVILLLGGVMSRLPLSALAGAAMRRGK